MFGVLELGLVILFDVVWFFVNDLIFLSFWEMGIIIEFIL